MPSEFRFWGRKDPRGREKPAIVAYAPEPSDGADPGEAVLRIYDPIDSWGEFWGVSAREFLDALDSVGSVDRIRLHLNSPGGEVYEAIAILNALRRHPATVTAVVDGIAASAASFIAAGVDRLVMAPNSELMIHDAWGIGIGPAATMRELADSLDRVSDNIASIYAAKAGTPAEDWRARMLAETWFSATDAVDAGLADEVEAPAAASDPAAAAARFDLTIFRARRDERVEPAADPEPILTPRQAAAFERLVASAGEAADRRARHQQRRHALAASRHGLEA